MLCGRRRGESGSPVMVCRRDGCGRRRQGRSDLKEGGVGGGARVGQVEGNVSQKK
jgi:hypothetical protein